MDVVRLVLPMCTCRAIVIAFGIRANRIQSACLTKAVLDIFWLSGAYSFSVVGLHTFSAGLSSG
jgi:hypothetical protein